MPDVVPGGLLRLLDPKQLVSLLLRDVSSKDESLDEVIWSAHETMPHSVVLCHKTDPSRTAIHLVETWSRVCSYIEEVQRDRAKKSPPPIGNLEHADESERQPSSLPSGWADLDIFWPAMDMALPLVQEAPDGESGNPQPIGVLDR
eukprot:3502271-Rhodomonas_salina.1